jgi:hypothetical protein
LICAADFGFAFGRAPRFVLERAVGAARVRVRDGVLARFARAGAIFGVAFGVVVDAAGLRFAGLRVAGFFDGLGDGLGDGWVAEREAAGFRFAFVGDVGGDAASVLLGRFLGADFVLPGLALAGLALAGFALADVFARACARARARAFAC